jgi:ribosomal protein S1
MTNRPSLDASDHDPRHGPDTLRVWNGVVVGVAGDDVFVELGPRMQGVISARVFDEPPRTGDRHEFTLRGQEDGLWALQLRDTKSLATWQEMEVGSIVHARVMRATHGGLELKIGPLHAFMPKSQSGLARDEEPQSLVGRNVTCEVIEVDRERQRVVVSHKVVVQRERESTHQKEVDSLSVGQTVQGRVTRVEPYGVFLRFGRGLEGLVHVSNLSHERVEDASALHKEGDTLDAQVLAIKEGGKKIALGIKQLGENPWTAAEKRFRSGQIVEGKVERLAEFGAFVAIAKGVTGLLHRSEMGYGAERSPSSVVKVGETVSVRIVDLDPEGERLSLSIVHESGARILPEEAGDEQSFERLVGEQPARPLGTSLADKLRAALGDR